MNRQKLFDKAIESTGTNPIDPQINAVYAETIEEVKGAVGSILFSGGKPKIYISGKITGLEKEEAEEAFEKAEYGLRNKGWDVVNPMKIERAHDLSWESYMKNDIKALLDCDAVFMLKGWEDSRGARVENDIVRALKIMWFTQNDDSWHPDVMDYYKCKIMSIFE